MSTPPVPAAPRSPVGALVTGGVTALLASACCLGPLVLVVVGISGAWIGNLVALERYQPLFVGVSSIALYFAWIRIWRPMCAPGDACALPRASRAYKLLFTLVVLLLLLALVFPMIAPWFY